MSNVGDEVELPNEFYKGIIDEIVKKEKFKTYEMKTTLAMGKGENYLGIIYRVKIVGKKHNGTDDRLNLIMKVPMDSAVIREKFPVSQAYCREVHAYNVMLLKLCALQDKYDVPETERFQFIKCYAASSENLKEYLALEDLNAQGFTMAQRRESLDYFQLKMLLQKLASYHALSFVLKGDNSKAYEELTQHAGGMEDLDDDFERFLRVSLDKACEIIDDPHLVERLKNFGKGYWEKIKYYTDAKSVDGYSVLCHGDCWNNNLLYKFEEGKLVDIRLLDWQMMKNSSPVTDIAYFIFTCTDLDTRRQYFDELMDIYYETLRRSLSYMNYNVDVCYPKSIFKDHLKKILPYGLIIATMILPASLGEPEDVPDMEELLKKETVDTSDMKIDNVNAFNRYCERIKGVVQSMVEMELI